MRSEATSGTVIIYVERRCNANLISPCFGEVLVFDLGLAFFFVGLPRSDFEPVVTGTDGGGGTSRRDVIAEAAWAVSPKFVPPDTRKLLFDAMEVMLAFLI